MSPGPKKRKPKPALPEPETVRRLVVDENVTV
jgi:hypothetical protein